MKKESLKTQYTEAGLCAIGSKICNAIKYFAFFYWRLSIKKKKTDSYCCFNDCKQVTKLSSLSPQKVILFHIFVCTVHVSESWILEKVSLLRGQA